MTRQLLILRHGKSDWGVDVEDFQRPLKKRGRRGAKAIGKWLRAQNLVPDHVCSSPATRAIDTAQRACKALGFDPAAIQQVERIYDARMEDLIQVLTGCDPSVRRVMMVGHNPGFEDLLLYLTGSDIPIPEDGKYLPTATVAVLDMPDDWTTLAPGSAHVNALVRAKELISPDESGDDDA